MKNESPRPSIAEIAPAGIPDIDDDNVLYDDAGEMEMPPERSFISRHRWLIALVIIVAAGTAYYMIGDDSSPSSAPLTVPVEFGDIENSVTAAGTLQASQYVEVGAQVSGQLDKLHVEVGDEVTEGQLLAEIDATVQLNKVEASRASLEAQEATLASRESALELARARLERQERMMAEEATSQDDYDDAVDRLTSAEASLAQLRSQIKQASASLASEEATLGYSKIYAPISGTVVSISMKEGQTLNATQQAPTILTIADLTTMTVEAEVSEADVSKLHRGMDVYFTTLGGGDRRWTGKLRQILPTPVTTNNVVLFTALFDVDNSDGALLTDMTAQVFFLTNAAYNVLKVPVASVTYASQQGSGSGRSGGQGSAAPGQASTGGQRPTGGQMPGQMPMGGQMPTGGQPPMGGQMPSGGGFQPGSGPVATGGAAQDGSGKVAYVKVVDANGKIEEREIRVGVTSRISAEVLSGLTAGERVVAGIVEAQTETTNSNQGPGGGMRFGPF